MEEEDFFVYARYYLDIGNESNKGSNSYYNIAQSKLTALTVSYTRNGHEKNKRISIDFDPFDYFNEVFLVVIEYHRCHTEHRPDNKHYCVKNICEYVKVFKTITEAQEFAQTINEKNFFKFIDNKDNRGYKLELSETFIEPVLISYEKP